MTKLNAKRSKLSDPPLSEEEHAELAWQENFRREQEERHSYLQQLSKAELIQLVLDVQDREEEFTTWLLSNGQGLIAYDLALKTFKETFDRLRELEYRRTKNQKKGRQSGAVDDVAKRDYAIELGVDDYYGLLCEAIVLFKKNPQLKENHATEAKAIREIIVNLLLQPNRSRHTHNQSAWLKIVNKNVKSNHLDTAKRRLNRANPTSF
jgi:hypothetical protein